MGDDCSETQTMRQGLSVQCCKPLPTACSQGEAGAAEEHTLPDGQRIAVRGEGVHLGELLVDQSPLGQATPSIIDCVTNACTAHPEPSIRKVALSFSSSKESQTLSVDLLYELTVCRDNNFLIVLKDYLGFN